MRSPKVVVGIPARMGSSRFPGKPLCRILDLPMIEHVYRRCRFSRRVDQVFIATCDEEIRQVVESFGGIAIMTDPEIARPALRVAEACKRLDLDDEDIVVVVQGDEPMVRPEMIEIAITPLLEEKDVFCVNLMTGLSEDQWLDSNEIKVVFDLNKNALYMSRSPIPSGVHPEQSKLDQSKAVTRMRQVCIFPFRKESLLKFSKMASTPLEIAESIEMLRIIEHGLKVRLVYSPFVSKSVDTESDRQEVEKLMRHDELTLMYIDMM